ncbi:uncharacterized protein [Gossypium hirsutum]|uniref:Uncharacterized protein n=1 Tax=Gossypium hirsutum TaxID=3635 RepID=A0A1U8P8D1_GOSHI|nr:uncharacterized protein LOC107956175 [Gossypium hirsutum]
MLETTGRLYAYGSLDHQIRDYPSKANTISEQSVCGAQRHRIHALIDPGLTHSDICTKIVKGKSLEVVSSEANVLVTNPIGQSIVVHRVIRNCLMTFGEHNFFHEFDAILGLDWLTRHNVMVDFRAGGVRLLTIEGKEVLLPNVQTNMAGSKFLVVFARKLILKGTDAYLAYIMDSSEARKDISQVMIMKEFSDVFPKELSGMQLDREVEFSVEVAPNTTPISCAPYRMAPLELNKLKK